MGLKYGGGGWVKVNFDVLIWSFEYYIWVIFGLDRSEFLLGMWKCGFID